MAFSAVLAALQDLTPCFLLGGKPWSVPYYSGVTDVQVSAFPQRLPAIGFGLDGEVRQISIRRANLDGGRAV